VTTIEAFESGVVDLKDFYFTGDDYSYKIEIEAKRRFLQLLKERFNSGVKYKGKTCRWDTVVLSKTQELERFLLGESNEVEFMDPSSDFRRSDTSAVRRRILELTQSKAKKLGIGKGTLNYLHNNARNERAFTICGKVMEKLGVLQ
jgi:CRISPR-associated protein Cas1